MRADAAPRFPATLWAAEPLDKNAPETAALALKPIPLDENADDVGSEKFAAFERLQQLSAGLAQRF